MNSEAQNKHCNRFVSHITLYSNTTPKYLAVKVPQPNFTTLSTPPTQHICNRYSMTTVGAKHERDFSGL